MGDKTNLYLIILCQLGGGGLKKKLSVGALNGRVFCCFFLCAACANTFLTLFDVLARALCTSSRVDRQELCWVD